MTPVDSLRVGTFVIRNEAANTGAEASISRCAAPLPRPPAAASSAGPSLDLSRVTNWMALSSV
jgi:hypothetical protein